MNTMKANARAEANNETTLNYLPTYDEYIPKILRVDLTRGELNILDLALDKLIDIGIRENRIRATDKLDLQPVYNMRDRIKRMLEADILFWD